MNSRYIGAFLAIGLAFTQVSLGYDFGNRGRSGRDGLRGIDGKDGNSVVIRATGQAQALNLSGTPGGYGESGERGEDAWSCFQPKTDRNLRGADGGDVTIFTNDVANLKSVLVQSMGGQ
jgi:hypothetical protein